MVVSLFWKNIQCTINNLLHSFYNIGLTPLPCLYFHLSLAHEKALSMLLKYLISNCALSHAVSIVNTTIILWHNGYLLIAAICDLDFCKNGGTCQNPNINCTCSILWNGNTCEEGNYNCHEVDASQSYMYFVVQ